MMSEKPLISLVIPFFNEELSLAPLLPLVKNNLDKANVTYEVLLIDDASNDNSLEVVENFLNESNNNYFKLIRMNVNSGQTGCFKKAFSEAIGEYIIRMDADLQDSPADLHFFIDKINENADIIMGIRENRKHSRALKLATAIYNVIIIMLYDSPLTMHSGSFVAFKSNFVKNIPFKNNDHRYLPLIAINRGASNIREIIVSHSERLYGSSNYSLFKKIIFGIPELIFFLVRLKTGFYKK
jgi:glycosyltransferase involved in cell wall biosynthesis